MVLFSATLRLPTRTRSVRRISRLRRALAVGFASIVLTTLPLRLILSAAGTAEWTTSWQVLELITIPFVVPFELIGSFNQDVARNVTIAELLATGVFGLLALYFLAMLTVRRSRS